MAGGGAHLPGSMAGGAHMPGSVASRPATGRDEAASGEHATHTAGASGAAHTLHASNASYRTSASGHESKDATHAREDASHAKDDASRSREDASRAHETADRAGVRADPRIGGAAALHTRGLVAGAAIGLGAGLAAHHVAASFMHAPVERDIGRDRAFVTMHAADFHARFVRDFTPVEFARWRGGVWSVGWHFGRLGWWWDVGGVWYPYAAPIYPYPVEVAALTVYGADTVDPGFPVAGATAIQPLPAAPAALYSCASPQGYFPAVQACGQPWQVAAATPDK
jgi:hypothetical protein